MVCTVLGSNSARGKKNRRNMKKFAAIYPHTAVQMSRLRNLLTGGFVPAAPVAAFAPSAWAGLLAAGGVATATDFAELGGLAGGRASSGFDIIDPLITFVGFSLRACSSPCLTGMTGM